MSKRNRNTERATRKQVAVSPYESTTEPTPTPLDSAAETLPPTLAPNPPANGDDEFALARLADDGASPAEVKATPPPSPPVALVADVPTMSANSVSLEQRVRRLEDALALLEQQREDDPRLRTPPIEARPVEPLPVPVVAPIPAPAPTSTAVLIDVGKRLLGAATQAVVATPIPVPSVAHPNEGGILWLLWDTWAEARIIVRMYVDPRYHFPWAARMLPLFLLAAILTSYYWVPGTTIPLLGWWFNKAVDLLLAFLLFKWLGHEARRYRQTSPDLPPNLRL